MRVDGVMVRPLLRSVASSSLRSSNFPGFSARGAAFGLNSLQLRGRAAHHIFPDTIMSVIKRAEFALDRAPL